MNYEFFSETPEVNEQKELLRNLEQGVVLEQRELLPEGSEAAEVSECFGTPEKDMENWHQQMETNSCAVSAQKMVAEQLLDREFPEKELIDMAKKQGWYRSESGTPESHVGNILEALGLNVEREKGQTLSDLAGDLQRGCKVICEVNNMILDNPEFAELPGQRANHAVEVIGIKVTPSKDVEVILNDSGVEDGRGRRVSADTFMKAWNTGRNFAVTAWKED